MRFTVFTPTFNRANLLPRVYESLLNQEFNDFEWIIVDDGSTDDTKSVIERFKPAFFKIIYKKINNHGKHNAINIGVSLANGQMFFIVDSDDWLPPYSLKKIDEIERTIPNSNKECYAGVCGLKGLSLTESVGTTFKGSSIDITSLERERYGINGDKSEVFYTNILKKYPFPVFDGENFMTECVVWDRIAFEGYKMRFFNTITLCVEYLEDGLTSNCNNLFRNNPRGWAVHIRQRILYKKLNGKNKYKEILYYLKSQKGLSYFEACKCLNINSFFYLLIILFSRIYCLLKKVKNGFKRFLYFIKHYSICKFLHFNFFSRKIERKNNSYIFIDRKSKLILGKNAKIKLFGTLRIETSKIDTGLPSNIFMSKNSTWECFGANIQSTFISVWDDGMLSTGSDFVSNSLTRICVEKNICFGKRNWIARNCYFNDSNSHDIYIDEKVVERQKNIYVGNDCWFCANVIVLKGVRIGNNVIIGAGSIVTKNIDKNMIYTNKLIPYCRHFDSIRH